MIRLHSLRTLIVLGLMALTTTIAHADEIYSNFGPGNTNTNNSGWGIVGAPAISYEQAIAGAFTPTQNFTLTSFDISAWHAAGTNSYLFSIVADNGGLPTGAVLVSPFSGAINGTFVTPAISSFAATGSLLAGQKYWLVMAPGAEDAVGLWNWNTIGAMGNAYSHQGGPWFNDPQVAPRFRINGTPVSVTTNLTPEVPAGVQAIPVLLAVGGMALYQRKKKSA
ncbi:MAG: choice-of-anchor R domain-containing protein [Armatimonas sp.]